MASYDMEDAMIVNKSSFERGFAHASVYKTEVVDLTEEVAKGEEWGFERPPINEINNRDSSAMRLDSDGLPPIGLYLQQGDIFLSTIERESHRVKYHKHMSTEPCYVEDVRLLDSGKSKGIQKVSIKMRYNRNPVVGDKFSSRHGQKGVMSVLWPQIDMPFTENGITPDVIINPNAFPSRMTIGMLIESMAGKSGALHGIYQDGSPFRFTEKNRAVDYFGEQLAKAGYCYYGSEKLYMPFLLSECVGTLVFGVQKWIAISTSVLSTTRD